MLEQVDILYVGKNEDKISDVKSVIEPEWNITAKKEVHEAEDAFLSDEHDCIVITDELDESITQNHRKITEDQETPVFLFGDDFTRKQIKRGFRTGIKDIVTGDEKTSSELNHYTRESIVSLQSRIAREIAKNKTDIQKTVFSGLQSLMGAADDELELKIDFVLESVGSTLEACECALYDYNQNETDEDEENTLKIAHEWKSSANEKSEHNKCQKEQKIGQETVPQDEFLGFDTHLAQFTPVCFNSNDPTPTPTDPNKQTYEADVGTLLAIPIVTNWELKGVFVITTQYPREWPNEIRTQLGSVAEFISHTKRRKEDRQQLKKQNEQLEEFTSVISHDLQNPLNIAGGYVEIAIETGETEHLTEAKDAIDRMENLITDLLQLAKSGDTIGDTKQEQVKPIVRDAWKNVDSGEASIEYQDIQQMEKIEADKSRLQEAIENLFKNAIDHVGKDVHILVEKTNNGFAVIDDGAGIPEDKMGKIFNQGYTGGDGTGLGLSIVQNIIDAHGWEIEATNTDDKGAKFNIITEP